MASESSRPATVPDMPLVPDAAPVKTTEVRHTMSAYPAPSLFRAFRRCWRLASVLGLLGGALVATALWYAVPAEYRAELRLSVAAADTTSASLPTRSMLEAVLRRPEVAQLPVLRNEQDPLAWLANHATLAAGAIPDLVIVRVTAPRSEEAVVLVQSMAEEYRAAVAHRHDTALQQLEERRRRSEEILRQKRERLTQLDHPRLRAADKEYQQARFDVRVARAELAELERHGPSEKHIVVSEQMLLNSLKEDPVGRERLHDVERAEENIQRLLRISALKERDPNLPGFYRVRDAAKQRLQARGEEIRPLVEKRERRRIEEEYQRQCERCRERVAYHEEIVKKLEREVQALGGGLAVAEELKALREEIAVAEDNVQKIANEEKRLREVSATGVEKEDAVAVVRKDAQDRWRPALAGGGSWCALLMLAVSWREARRRRIASGSDLSQGLGLPLLGNIPVARLDPTMAAQLEGGDRIGEAVDALRTVLLNNNNKVPKLVLVTSAVPGEGKTSLAVLLAASLARAWRKTLLLDADLRKPKTHELFDLPLEPGLSEVLRGEAEIADAVQPTDLSRLWLMSAGQGNAHALQALAQDGAGKLFDPLKEQFDFIVLDASPILPVADALLLCPHVDAVLLAVRSGMSRLPFVRAAQQRLAALAAPLRGAVLLGPDDDFDGKSVIYPTAKP
jgi:succinoglycan biosynthesis transport protein ExoP